MRKTRGKVTSYNTPWNLIQQRLDDALEIAQQKQLLARYEREKRRKESEGASSTSGGAGAMGGASASASLGSATTQQQLGDGEGGDRARRRSSSSDESSVELEEKSERRVTEGETAERKATAAAATNVVAATSTEMTNVAAAPAVVEASSVAKKKVGMAKKKRGRDDEGRGGANSETKTTESKFLGTSTAEPSEPPKSAPQPSKTAQPKSQTSQTKPPSPQQPQQQSPKKQQQPEIESESDKIDSHIDRALEKIQRDPDLLNPCFECGSRLTHHDHQKNIAAFVKLAHMSKTNTDDDMVADRDADDDDSIIVAGTLDYSFDEEHLAESNGKSPKGTGKKITSDLIEKLFTSGGGTGACLRTVEIIDVRSPNAEKLYHENTLNGIPVVLSGHQGFTAFAEEWVARGNLGLEGFLESCGEARAPIAKRGYQGNQISRETMLISKFVDDLFSSNDNSLYLAQWQFPLEIFKALRRAKKAGAQEEDPAPSIDLGTSNGRRSSSRRKRGLLNPKWFSSILPDCVGFDMLQHSCAESFVSQYSTARANKKQAKGNKKSPGETIANTSKRENGGILIGGEEINGGEVDPDDRLDMAPVNPYQYLFLGGPLTYTQLHNDPGGMSILIAPIVGEKEVIMVHRDDLDLPYDIECNYEIGEEPMDGNRFPGVMLARSWRVVLTPGDILVMPPRTFHAVRNLTPSLAYSRCHFGPNELVEMMRSYFVKDSPEMEHRRVVWNAAHAIMEEFHDDPSKAWTVSSHSLLVTNSLQGLKGESASMKLVALRAIRSCVLMFHRFLDADTPSKSSGNNPRSLKSVASSLKDPNSEAAEVSTPVEDEYDWKGLLMDIDTCLELCKDSATSKTLASISTPFATSTSSTENMNKELDSTEELNKEKTPVSQAPLSEMFISVSDVVALNPACTCPDRQRRWANVLKVELKKQLVYISYDVFGQEKNEFIPIENVLENLGPKNGPKKANNGVLKKPKKKKAKLSSAEEATSSSNNNSSSNSAAGDDSEGPLAVGDRVRVPWKVSDELVERTMATVLEITQEDAVLLQFHRLGPEFNQWHAVKNITYVI